MGLQERPGPLEPVTGVSMQSGNDVSQEPLRIAIGLVESDPGGRQAAVRQPLQCQRRLAVARRGIDQRRAAVPGLIQPFYQPRPNHESRRQRRPLELAADEYPLGRQDVGLHHDALALLYPEFTSLPNPGNRPVSPSAAGTSGYPGVPESSTSSPISSRPGPFGTVCRSDNGGC